MSQVKRFLSLESGGRVARLPARSASEDGQPASRLAKSYEASRGAFKCPPSSNTGGTKTEASPTLFKNIADQETISLVLTDTGDLKQVMVRRPANGHCAFIDCLRFTLGEETWCATAGEALVGDEEYIRHASYQLEGIFGFGITRNLRKPRDFYSNSWELGDGFGLVCFGGQEQRATMLVVLHGSGCMAAREGWEGRLHEFLTTKAKRAVITRVDLAHDCFDGDYVNVDIADQWFDDGGFNCSYRAPSHEYRGNWKHPDGNGRTLYIGKRKNGKLCRVYEKGREQGDASSEWTRIEVEFRNTDRIISFGVLCDPSSYLVGAYPCLQLISAEHSPERIACKTKTAEINVDACVGHIKRTYGKHLKVLRGLFGDQLLLTKVESDTDEWPERLKVPDYQWSDVPLHKCKSHTAFNEFDVDDGYLTTPAFGSTGDFGASGCQFH